MSIGTPGEVLGYAEAYRRFGGGVSWSSLFEETIRLCEEGFEVSHPLSFALAKHRDEILLDPQLRLDCFFSLLCCGECFSSLVRSS